MTTMNKILSHGLAAGLLAGLPLFGVTVALQGHPPSAWGAVFGYLTMLVALSAVFVAIKRRRDVDLGGVIRFWPAFGLGVAISLVAAVIYVVCWEAALAYTGMDFAGEYSRALIARQQAEGASAEAVAALTAEMAKFQVQYANPVFRALMTFAEIFPVGLLVSAVSAGLLRNSRFLSARST